MSNPVAILQALREAVAAATADEAGRFDAALQSLHRLDPAQVTTVQAIAVRALLEAVHPDGMDGDDLRAVLTGCLDATPSAYPGVDAAAILGVLTSALGLFAPEEQAPLEPESLVTHGCLVIAELARTIAMDPGTVLEQAMSEVRREQVMELP